MKVENSSDSHQTAEDMIFLLFLTSAVRIRFFPTSNYKVFRYLPFVLVAEEPFSVGLKLSLQINGALGTNR